MPRLINWEMLANPLNWLVVFLMLAFAGLAIHYAIQGIKVNAVN